MIFLCYYFQLFQLLLNPYLYNRYISLIHFQHLDGQELHGHGEQEPGRGGENRRGEPLQDLPDDYPAGLPPDHHLPGDNELYRSESEFCYNCFKHLFIYSFLLI